MIAQSFLISTPGISLQIDWIGHNALSTSNCSAQYQDIKTNTISVSVYVNEKLFAGAYYASFGVWQKVYPEN